MRADFNAHGPLMNPILRWPRDIRWPCLVHSHSVIDHNFADAFAGNACVEKHHGHIPVGKLIQQVLVHLGGHDGHALHFALQHAAYAQRHTRGIVVRGAHQNLVAILNGDVLEAFDELREERTCDVRYDQPEDAAASGHQRARLRVGVVAQLLDDFPDPLSGLRVSLPTGMCPWCFSTQAIAGEGISKVVVDYAMGVNEAMDHLMSLGHRRIGFISGPWALKSARIRRTAFLRSLSAYGIDEDKRLVEEGDHTVDGGLIAMTRMLESKCSPTALLASNDLTAIGAMRAVRRTGLSVPGDISIVGFDDIRLAEFTEPPLTTVRLSRQELDEHAFHALLGVGEQPDARRKPEHIVETHLVIRETTCPARA